MRALFQDMAGFYLSRLRRNAPGYLREFWPYLVLVVLAAFLDFLTTWRFMVAGSVSDEVHPVIRLAASAVGPFAGALMGKLGQLAAIVFLTLVFRPAARVLFLPVTLIYLYAAWYNVWGIELYTPIFLRWLSF